MSETWIAGLSRSGPTHLLGGNKMALQILRIRPISKQGNTKTALQFFFLFINKDLYYLYTSTVSDNLILVIKSRST